VDDEERVVSLVGQMLRIAGYKVVQAVGPQEALRTFDGSEIDLVVTDVHMPGMDGLELAARLRAVDPDLRAIFMSGDAHAVSCPAEVLEKPFRMADLHRRVAEALTAGVS
jgi:CheY-like chemotaxis protein